MSSLGGTTPSAISFNKSSSAVCWSVESGLLSLSWLTINGKRTLNVNAANGIVAADMGRGKFDLISENLVNLVCFTRVFVRFRTLLCGNTYRTWQLCEARKRDV